jgi:hypothetical protein
LPRVRANPLDPRRVCAGLTNNSQIGLALGLE